MKRDGLEGIIQRDIEAALGAEPGVLLLRNSVGKATFTNPNTGAACHVPFGLGVGSPDLVLFLAPDGTACGLEVKVPGEEADEHQARCHRIWRTFGVHVEVVHSVGDALAALERARAKLLATLPTPREAV